VNCPRCGKDVSIGGAHTCRPKADCRGEELKVGDRIWVSVKEEHKNIFTPESTHNFSGFIWQIDDEYVYVKSSSGALNRYPWWAIDYKTDMDIDKPEPEQDENSMMEYDKWSAINNPIKAGYVGTFKAGYKSGQTSRNAEIAALKAEIESMRLGYQAIKGLLSFWSEMDKKDWEQMLEDVDDIVIGQLDKDS